VRLKGKGIRVCFTNTLLDQRKLGRLSLRPKSSPAQQFLFFFFLWAGSIPAVQAELDLVGLARSLAQTSDQASHATVIK